MTAACLAGAVAVPSLAPCADSLPPSIDVMIDDLDAPDFAARRAATERLMISDALRLDDVEQILEQRDLTPEQQHRLLAVARERFANTERGAMGVRFDLRTIQSRVVIEETIEGFPSNDILQRGDVIIRADGEPVRGDTRTTLRSIVFSHDPGDKIPIVVRRGAEKLTFDLELGLARDLKGNQLLPSDIAQAWHVRSRRLLRINERAVVPAPEAGRWPEANDALERRRAMALKRNFESAGPPSLVAGGEPRERAGDDRQAWLASERSRLANAGVFIVPPSRLRPADELRDIQVEQRQLEQNIETIEQMLSLDGLPQQQRNANETMLENARDRLEILKLVREAIEAEIAEAEAATDATPTPP